MTTLDPVTARLFPSVAKFVRRQRRKGLLFTHGIALVIGLAVGVLLMGYRGRVSDENYQAWGLRLNALEAQYQQEHPKSLRTTKAQSAVLVEQAQKAKEGR
jgi:uncharacterized membrane-anchored protein YhcB (DUF1043 family)